MTEGQKNTVKTTVSLISVFGTAVTVLIFVFVAAMAASCAAAPKAPAMPQSETGIVYLTRICDDQVSEFIYTKDIIEVCMTNTGGYTAYDIGCNGKNLEVCDNEMSYIIVGGTEKTYSRNCVLPADKEKGIKNTHLRCLSEVIK